MNCRASSQLDAHFTAAEQTSLSADDRFHVLLVLNGEGVLSCEQIEHRLTVGTTLLVPASCSASRIVAFDELTLLDVFVPSVKSATQQMSRAAFADHS